MLPTVLTRELMEGVEAFLRSTFPTSTPSFRGAFDEILGGTGRNRLFQGPYLRVGLPFQPGVSGRDYFPRLETAFAPYVHQERAWGRLRTEAGESTLVATGTGSGKTECFSYPILDHILANPGQRGIKAIVLYPMNALATDQARRLAREIHRNPACQGRVRAGLYVGGLEEGEGSKVMSEGGVITCRTEMRASPPDILLTNYKMLDYLLVRQDDRTLWADNAPDALRYLVVDELHSFDGAQGTDLACLIRRLKARVKTPAGHLCCVGTSATLGGVDSGDEMTRFAELVFGEGFSGGAVITETRKTASAHIENEAVEDLEILYFEPPGPEHHDALSAERYPSAEAFVRAQAGLWFGREGDFSTLEGRVRLSNLLRRHNFLRIFLGYFKGGVLEEEAILADLKGRRAGWEREHHRLLVNSFASLCCAARNGPAESAYFLQVRGELWMRELSRMVASVSPAPVLRFSMDLPPDHPQRHLPAIHCRDCGVMGWGAVQKSHGCTLQPELDRFYQAFFSYNPDPRLRFVFPAGAGADRSEALVEQFLCSSCLALFESADGTCPDCGTAHYGPAPDPDQPVPEPCTIRVECHVRTFPRRDFRVADKSCPYCESTTGLMIVGSRAASLTSVGISQLFGSPFNDDKKAMAFSDSVQDASHRASFFSARTYQVAVRTALCGVIARSEEPPSLDALSHRFPAACLADLGAEDFVGTFIPPTIEWFTEFENFKEDRHLGDGARLPTMVSDRLQWEVIREFGMQCRIGRTLEKSGAAAAYLDPAALADCVGQLSAEIEDIVSALFGLTDRDVERLLAGVCERLRRNGGIDHGFIASYLEQRGNPFPFNRSKAGSLPRIPPPGSGIRPTFFASFAVKDSFERLIASGTSPSWVERWVEKWLRALIGDRAKEVATGPIIEALVERLTASGLWRKHEIAKGKGEFAWALNPERVLISDQASHLACHECGHQVTTASPAQDIWKGTPCLRHKCVGHYRLTPGAAASFFGDLYRRGDVVRVRAAEHTGLLDRATRERVEAEFMRDPSLSTDTKLISCTPTMEMGVDVGDLSTVLLCSVPPERSNYIQRVGRGGRRDGNSVALTVATSAAHDLTYYEDPLKMLAGEVEMPAIFLRAPAVLERQLTAFCVDRWIESTPSALIPREMETLYVQLAKEEDGDAGGDENAGAFPGAFYRFIELNLTELMEGFEGMFARGELDEESVRYLRDFIRGDDAEQGSLVHKINTALAAAFKDRDALYDRRKKLHSSIANNKKKAPRDERLDLEQDHMLAERKGISRLIKAINKKQTLNFLTDEGLLPNYAFPEEGVTLRSIILRRPEADQETRKLVKLEFEHMRPAEAAISELAPGSAFYVEGRKLTVDQVSVERDDYEEWHFCRSCSHLEPVSTRSESNSRCPRCHCDGWRDSSLKQQMLKMHQVFVTDWDYRVRNYDQKDERDLTTFNRQTSIDFGKEAISKSYMLKAEGATFAFDFINQVTLRDVNFGEDRRDAEAVQIGGRTLHGVGFRVCRACGKIQPRRKNDEAKHDISCKHFGRDVDAEEFETTFLLYRELQSEAIRLLIPSLGQDENVDTQSFVAAIHLGLKEKFGGHLSHLKLAVQQLPIEGSTLTTQHVFIYDGVPGGTGYLKDLTRDADALLDVLERAHAALRGCSCADDPELDGCYQCIKAYRFRYVQNLISRLTALRQLGRILENRGAIEERSPDESLINPLLESELERRFIESLRQAEGFKVNPQPVGGRPGFLLRIGGTAWEIAPQVELGPGEGVAIPCRPDFLLRPLRAKSGPPIAVFLDGFAFHADVELGNNRIADDIAKRSAVRDSGRFLVWSLTWADLRGTKPPPDAPLAGAYGNLASLISDRVPELAEVPAFRSPEWNSWDLLQALLSYLATGGATEPLARWGAAVSYLACNFPRKATTREDSLRTALEDLGHGRSPGISPAPPPESQFATIVAESGALHLLSAVPLQSIQEKHLDGLLCASWFDDRGDKPPAEFQADWQELLRSFNLLQFLSRFTCITRGMASDEAIDRMVDRLLAAEEAVPAPAETVGLTEAQLDELELLHPTLQPVLVPLLRQGEVPWPAFGFEATTEGGRCGVSILEVAWPEKLLGIALPDEDPADFTRLGWTILRADNLDADGLKTYFAPNP